MKMKYFGISCGWLFEEFVLFPYCGIRWMKMKEGIYIDIMFSIFFWHLTIGQIKNKLKEQGYL